jgi:hypothetical protein
VTHSNVFDRPGVGGFAGRGSGGQVVPAFVVGLLAGVAAVLAVTGLVRSPDGAEGLLTAGSGMATAGGTSSSTGNRKRRATAYAGVAGGVLGAATTYALSGLHLRYVATIVGSGSPTVGMALFATVALVLTALYTVTGARFVARGRGFVRRSATTGLAFGAVLGGAFSLFAVPALVGDVPVPQGESIAPTAVVGGWAVFGFGMGTTYAGVLSEEELLPGFLRRSGGRVVVSALAGVYVGGLALLVVRPPHLRYVGTILGSGTQQRGLLLLLLVGLVLTLLVARYAGERTAGAPFSTGVFVGIGTTVLGLFVVPALVGAIGGWPLRVPIGYFPVAFGYFLFGFASTAAYGVLRRGGIDLLADVRSTATLKGLLGGGTVSGGLLVLAAEPHLLWLGTLLRSGTAGRGLLAWFVVCLPFAVLLAAVPGRRFDASTSTLDAGMTGLVYGVGYAIVAGVALVPTVVDGVTPLQPYPAPYVGLGLFAYVLFGFVFAAVYRESLPLGEPRSGFTTAGPTGGFRTPRAYLFGSLFGALTGGLAIHHLGGPVEMRYIGSVFKMGGSFTKAWLAWLVLALLLGGLFAILVRNKLDDYVNSLIMTSSRNDDLRRMLQPALKQAAVTTTSTAVGLAYGVALAVVLGAVGLPLLVENLTVFSMGPAPNLDGGTLLGFVLYGGFLGAGYGLVLEF